jgi:hypothetical protein
MGVGGREGKRETETQKERDRDISSENITHRDAHSQDYF